VLEKMEFRLLGPVEVRRDERTVPVPAGKQRAVLAALLLNAGRVVSAEELAEALWGSRPPRSARVTLQNYVRRLRQALGDAGRERIITQPGGYLIRVEADELDLARFEALLARARTAARASAWETAARQARAALALWRGAPLADVESETLAAQEVPRLAEARLQALEARISADIRLGRPDEVIGELSILARQHPFRERLHGLLMLALYRDGRQAEALAAYQQARRVLADELGAEPGPELRALHQRILSGQPVLDRAPPQPRFPEHQQQVLLVMSDTAAAAQIQSLLPPAQPCAIVVTGPDELTRLVPANNLRRAGLDRWSARQDAANG